ncbi:MAG: zinc dependent phospholipase C family protein [Thermodesulfobacteriota bacterium]
MIYIAIPSIVLFFLLIPAPAFAWGPATHLEIGEKLLANAALLAPAVKFFLDRFPSDFLYGNISADIVVGKNLVEELKHCHNWKMGFRLLKKAKNDPQRAFAYGYLSHLAADTIAHNHFIPEMMMRSFRTRMHRHIYWELRFDAMADKRMWKLPKDIARGVDPGDDLLLDALIEASPLSFKTNKTIFSSMLNLQHVEKWHRLLDRLSSASKWELHREDKDRFFSLAYEASRDVLTKSHDARCVKKDPTGRHNLNSAKFMRKKLKRIRRTGRDWETALDNALSLVRIDP